MKRIHVKPDSVDCPTCKATTLTACRDTEGKILWKANGGLLWHEARLVLAAQKKGDTNGH